MAIKGAQGVCFNKERNIEWQGADINFQVYLIERERGGARENELSEVRGGVGREKERMDGDRKREESVGGEGGEVGSRIC